MVFQFLVQWMQMKDSAYKLNTAILKNSWIKQNIELLPEPKDKGYIMAFRFIDNDVTIKSTNVIYCDANCVYLNCAMYAANYLLDKNYISEELYKEYCELLKQFAVTNKCYS